MASGKRILQVRLAKHLSMRSQMRLMTCLRFDHVYYGPKKPRSKKLHLSRQALKSKALLRLIFLPPPSLSFPLRIPLKSPRKSQGKLCKLATCDRLDHKIFLSFNRGLAYTNEISHVSSELHTLMVACISYFVEASTNTSTMASMILAALSPATLVSVMTIIEGK